MIYKKVGRYDNRARTWLGTLTIPPNDDKVNNYAGSNAFGKHSSIYSPTMTKFIIRGAQLARN
jgi:hypothetical protein